MENEPDKTKQPQSLGDKFKRPLYNAATYFGLNGAFNLIFSVAIAYICERHFDAKLDNYANKMGTKLAAKTGWSEKRLINTLYMGPKGILLSGGTLLLPVIKWLEDHHSRLEFKLGHRLDKLQEFFGKGNEATKRNDGDYAKIQNGLAHGTVELTPEESNRFSEKYHLEAIDSNTLAFKEYKLTWKKIIAARASALVTTTFGMSSLMGFLGLREKFEQSGPAVTRGISKIFPWYKKVFAEPDIFSKNLAGDVILTVSSAATHKIVQDILHKPKHDAKLETADLKHAIKFRKKELPQAAQGFRNREDTRTAEQMVAI